MDKVLTFVGPGPYDRTTYHWPSGVPGAPTQVVTEHFAEALGAFYPNHALISFATDEAMRATVPALDARLRQRPAGFQPQRVPDPDAEADLWAIFEIISQQVADDDHIIFDITHSFRSLPLLAFLAIAYLRVVKRAVQVTALLYAPHRLGDDRTQVHNLIQFVDLLDWTSATNLFIRTGHAAQLVEQIKEDTWYGSSRLSVMAPADLEAVSAALRLARPDEARKRAHELASKLGQLEPDLDLSGSLKPFGLLFKRIQSELEQIAPAAPDPKDLRQELAAELALVEWNLGRGQLMSAVTVAREWLVSLVFHLDKQAAGEDWHDGDQREIAERKVLGTLKDLALLDDDERKRQIGQKSPRARVLWERDPIGAEALGRAWNLVANLRNDLNHAGKVTSTSPRSLHDVLNEAEQVPGLLKGLAGRAGLS